MKIVFLLVLLTVHFAFGVEYYAQNYAENYAGEANHIIKWENFKHSYGKNYDNENEEQFRMEEFIRNVKKAKEHNAKYEYGEVSYRMRINKFSDISREEFISMATCVYLSPPSMGATARFINNMTHVPDSFDWRDTGAVTPVKNQGSCGGCCAFAAAAAMETSFYLKSGTLIDLSPQNFIDCVTTSHGCNGGFMEGGFQFAKENSMNTEADYPYEEQQGICRFKRELAIPEIEDYQVYSNLRADEMKKLVTISPLAVAVGVGGHFQAYADGIFSDCSPNLNHAVTIVGYGTTINGEDYWIIKNSWGTDWGMNGYMLHKRGDDDCGLNQYVSLAGF